MTCDAFADRQTEMIAPARAALRAELDARGFVVLAPLLSGAECERPGRRDRGLRSRGAGPSALRAGVRWNERV